MKTAASAALLIALLASAIDSQAQFQRREKGQSPREQAKERERDNPKAVAIDLRDPYSALERELPSLRADLKLTGDQVNAWSVFDRDVRCARPATCRPRP